MKDLQIKNLSRWDFYSAALIFGLAFIIAFKWLLLPTFIDIYYHLIVVRGLSQAGGFVTTDFWQYAPFGRAHLYPPLLHTLMLLFYKSGFSLITTARIFELSLYPVLFLVVWRTTRDLFNERLAFFAVLIGTSLYSFYLSAVNFMPASLALILGLLAFLFLEKDKIIASALCLGLCFYAHAGTPWIFVISFIIYAVWERQRLTQCLRVVSLGVVLALPLLAYQYISREYIAFYRNIERFPLEINLLVYLAAIPGIVYACKQKGRYRFMLALLGASTLPLFFGYWYRYLSGQGQLALIFLSAVSVEKLYAWLSGAASRAQRKPSGELFPFFALAVISAAVLLFSPTILFKDSKINFHLLNSTYCNFIGQAGKIQRPNEYSIYFKDYFDEIAAVVKDNSRPYEILYCTTEYGGGLISVLADRATSTAMLREIGPYKQFDPIAHASIIVWIKNPKDSRNRERLEAAVGYYKLAAIAETEFAFIYRNEHAQAQKIPVKAAVSNTVMFGALVLVAGLALFDIGKMR